MTVPWTQRVLHLTLHPERYTVARFPDNEPPDAGWGAPCDLLSVTCTGEGWTVVGTEDRIPPGGIEEKGWRHLEVRGPLDFGEIGVLASLSSTLADAGVPLFVISSFETDHLLIRESEMERAVDALSSRGHRIVRGSHSPRRGGATR